MSDERPEDEESPDDGGASAQPDSSEDATDASGSTGTEADAADAATDGADSDTDETDPEADSRTASRSTGSPDRNHAARGAPGKGASTRPGPKDASTSTDADESTSTGADESASADEDAPSDDSSDASSSSSSASSSSSSSSSSTETAGDGGLLGGHGDTPPDDEELPLTEHIEEMLSRLAIVVVIASFVALAAFPFADDAIIQIWYDVHDGSLSQCLDTPQAEGCVAPHLYSPAELVLMRLRFAGLAGLLAALPLAVYQTYRFMRPGLYPHERRYYLASVPFSLVLGVVGMLFSYFVILPLLFTYFITYTEGSAEIRFALADTMNLVLIMLGMMAIIFQIPLLIMLAIMMGITSRRWLEERRIYFWGLFLGIAFLFGPDPTGMAPILLTVTMIVLYEGSLLLLRWTGR